MAPFCLPPTPCHRLPPSTSLSRLSPPPASGYLASRSRISHRFSMCYTPFREAPYRHELEAAIDVVERACRLCASVQASMKLNVEGKLDKSDHSPVTVADFSVQALVSMELGMLFPSIPFIGEEDSAALRKEFMASQGYPQDCKGHLLAKVVEAVKSEATPGSGPITGLTILDAIDKGGGKISGDGTSASRMSTFWVLDPIDGTRGFLKGGDALYVIGLALVVQGKLVLGVMGCPNITCKPATSSSVKRIMQSASAVLRRGNIVSLGEDGVIMAAHSGCGSWLKSLSSGSLGDPSLKTKLEDFVRCSVDGHHVLKEAVFTLSDHEVWEESPLAKALSSDSIDDIPEEAFEANVLRICCGSLCKYFAVAIGSASVVLLWRTPGTAVKVWDHAAGVICVVESGGKVSDGRGTAVEKLLVKGKRIFLPEGGIIVASNTLLHTKVLSILYEQIL